MVKLLLKIWRLLKLPPWVQLFIMRRIHDQFLIGTTGVFFDERGKILLVKHSYRDNGYWSLPGGYARKGEHPKETLEREIEEETGIATSVTKILIIRTDRDTARLDITYFGRVIKKRKFKPNNEIKTVNFFSTKNLPPLPKDQVLFIEKGLIKRRRYLRSRQNDIDFL